MYILRYEWKERENSTSDTDGTIVCPTLNVYYYMGLSKKFIFKLFDSRMNEI